MAVKLSKPSVLPVVLLTLLIVQGCQTSGDGEFDGGGQASRQLSLEAQNDSLTANGTDSTAITLTARDASGNVMANTAVTFVLRQSSASGATPPPPSDLGDLSPAESTTAANASTVTTNATGDTSVTGMTNANGMATVLLTAGTATGDVEVVASAGSFSVSTGVTYVAGPPETVTLSVADEAVNVNASTTVTATVRDVNDNPVSDVTVAFTISDNNSGGSLQSLSATTDSDGEAQVTYEAGDASGTDEIEATTGADGSVTGTVTITVIIPASDLTLAADPTRLVQSDAATGNKTSTITATLSGESGPIANATVSFRIGTPLGTTSMTRFQSTGNQTASATTNASGQATVTFESGDASGEVQIIAQSQTLTASLPLTITAESDTLTLSASPSSIIANGTSTSTVTATLSTASNNPVAGATISFASTAGSIDASGVTDDTGQVTVLLRSSPTAALATVTASLGVLTATVRVAFQTVTDEAANLELLVSSPQLDSDGSESVTLTALVRNANNNLVPGATVSFSADSGGIQIERDTTDATGTATALLSPAGDPTNRTITVTAAVGTLTSTNTVNVTGTTVTLSGTSALVIEEKTTLSILLRDAGEQGIANQPVKLSSSLGNTLSPSTVTTDSNGQATFQVTADADISETDTTADTITDTITATALGASGTLSLTISLAHFVFITPDTGTEVDLNTMQTITVHWDENDVNQDGETINFFATRGMLSADSAVTDADGNASVTITSSNAGPAAITAVAAKTGGPSSQIEIEFVATNPTSLILQARPTTLGINAPGTSDQQSTITAVVRDAIGNLVKNQEVSFTLDDVSGGSIFPAFAITDSFGRARTVYTAGAASSAQDGVLIDAKVAGTSNCTPTDPIPSGPCDRVTLTVAQQELFIALGTGNLIEPLSSTQYAKPYSVLVTDANSNPVEGATVELNIYPTRYQKGFYVRAFDGETCVGWVKSLTVTPGSPPSDNDDQACNNEDVNRNGVLNMGEDINNNGTLEPGNIAAAPTNITTDATGFAFFDITYAREFTWVEIELEARATVFGSESSSTARFFLPGLAADFENCDVAPPGQISPYGVATTCACDESTDSSCPRSISITSISGSFSLPAGGGTLAFHVEGGVEKSYTVSTTAGTLQNESGQTGSSVQVNFGEDFTLTTTSDQDGATIILTAEDNDTGQQGTATITQAEPEEM
jgi:hypothetical protein